MTAARYDHPEAALTGPSAERVHRCYPRALGEAYVAVPKPFLVGSPGHRQLLRKHVSALLRREFPRRRWIQLGVQHAVDIWLLTTDEVEVRVQFVQWRGGWRSIPLTPKAVELRYCDLGEPATPAAPTPSGFATLSPL